MKLKAARILILISLILWSLDSFGQRRARTQRPTYGTFQAGLLLGGNLAQLDGDFFTGYDNSGIYAGIRGVANISRQISLTIDMLYSQKGSKIPHGVRLTSQRSVNDRIIDLDYAEVPIALKMNLTNENFAPYLEFGFSYGRLIDSEIREKSPDLIEGTIYSELVDDFSSTDLGVLAGFGISSKRKFDVGLRLTFSFTRLYNAIDPVEFNPLSGLPREVEFLRNYHASLFVGYRFL